MCSKMLGASSMLSSPKNAVNIHEGRIYDIEDTDTGLSPIFFLANPA
ncbi:hypothetical protein [Hoylesella timonensis]|nr:hypothetical protein [Hoylesella timonensis]